MADSKDWEGSEALHSPAEGVVAEGQPQEAVEADTSAGEADDSARQHAAAETPSTAGVEAESAAEVEGPSAAVETADGTADRDGNRDIFLSCMQRSSAAVSPPSLSMAYVALRAEVSCGVSAWIWVFSSCGIHLSQGKGLRNLQGIDEFPLLQTLQLSNNDLTSLQELSALKYVRSIDASHNALETVLDFEVTPRLEAPAEGESEEDVAGAVLRSGLTTLNVSHNKIAALQPLMPRHSALRHIDVSHNALTSLLGLANLPQLWTLNASHNALTTLSTALNFAPLRFLDLSHNDIRDIDGLQQLKHLEQLDLSHNRIESLKGLQQLTSLSTLNVASNAIHNVQEFELLEPLRALARLDVRGNSCMDSGQCRLRIIYRCDR